MQRHGWNLLFGVLLGVVLAVIAVPLAQAGTLPSLLTWTTTDTVDAVQIDKGAASAGPFTKLATVAAGVKTYTDATNSAGTTACYRVEHVSGAGLGPVSNVACKVFPSVPAVAPVLSPIQ